MRDWLLFRLAFRDVLRPGALLATLFLTALPGLLGLIHVQARRFSGTAPEAGYDLLAGMLVFGFSVVSQELEQKTIVFLLTRPVARFRVLLARYCAAVCTVILTVTVSTLVLAGVVFGWQNLGQERVLRDLWVLPLGALAYTSLFTLLSTVLQKPLIYGLGFVFGWESWVPFMPGSFRNLSVMTYLRALAAHAPPDTDGNQLTNLLNALNPTQIAPDYARGVLIAVTLAALGLAVWAFSVREYVPADAAD